MKVGPVNRGYSYVVFSPIPPYPSPGARPTEDLPLQRADSLLRAAVWFYGLD